MEWRAPNPKDKDAWRNWHASYNKNYDREVRHCRMRAAQRMAAMGVFMVSGMSGFTILVLQLFGQ